MIKRKFISIALILISMLTCIALVYGEEIVSFVDIKANGRVKIESIQDENGYGLVDSGVYTGEFDVNGKMTLTFPKDSSAQSRLEPGDYFYRISQVNKGAAGVTYDDAEYVVWVGVDYGYDADVEDPKPFDENQRRYSIVIKKDDGSTEKPTEIIFQNTKEDTITVTRTITYTKYTKDGEKMFETVTQEVTLKRTVVCDGDGNPLDSNGKKVPKGDRNAVVIGSNGNPIVYVDSNGKVVTDPSKGTPVLGDGNGNPALDSKGKVQPTTVWQIDNSAKNDLSEKKSPTADGWNHTWIEAPGDATNKKDLPAWDADGYINQLDLNNPQSVVEHVVYTEKPTHTEPEYKTVTRTIYYKEYNRKGDVVFKKVVQEVKLVRDNTYDEDGKLIAEGKWRFDSPKDDYGPVTSKTKSGWQHRWDTMDGTDRAGMPDVLGWDDPTNPNRINLDDPQDLEEYVIYTPKGSKVETETITIKRTIYYKRIDRNGNEVFEPFIQEVTLKRTKTLGFDGKETLSPWEIASDPSKYGPITSGNLPGHSHRWDTMDGTRQEGMPDVLGWLDPKNPNCIDMENPRDQVEYVIYTPETLVEEEEKEITRTIYYMEYDKDGKEVVRKKVQKVQLKRTKTTNPDGTVTYGSWEIVGGDTSAVKSPDHDKKAEEGWMPDRDVDEWIIDLNDPKDVEEWVFYTIERTYWVKFEDGDHGKSDGKGDEEGKLYGSYPRGGNSVTPNDGYKFTGKYAYVITDEDGNVIERGVTDDPTSVKVIGNITFTPIYQKIETPISVKTGDESKPWIYGGILGAAVILFIALGVLRRKKKR